MSGMTQFVVAKRGEETEISNHNWPTEDWTGCDGFKFFGPSNMGLLHAIMCGGSGSYTHFPEVAFGEFGWVYDMPGDLVNALAASDARKLVEVAEGWAARLSETKMGTWSTEELLELHARCSESRGDGEEIGKTDVPLAFPGLLAPVAGPFADESAERPADHFAECRLRADRAFA